MEQNTKPYKRIVYKAFLFLYIRKKELFKAVWPWPIRCPGHCPEWIRKARQKTKNMCNIPLLEEARKILNRYKEHPYCQAHSVLLPVCSNQKMNMYLKELADICGIQKHLSTHTARHTFATLTLASGATIDNVAKMLGHTNTNMTRHYARILDSSIMRDMQIVAKNIAM